MIKLKWISKEAGKYRPTRSDNKKDVKFGEVVEVDKETADYYLSAYSKHFELATSEVKAEAVVKSEVKKSIKK